MTTATSAACPNCGGPVMDQICQKCGAFIENQAAAGRAAVGATPSPVSAHPTSMAGVAGPVVSMGVVSRRPSQHGGSTSRSRHGPGSDLVQLPPEPPVNPNALIRPGLSVPPGQRFCANPERPGNQPGGTPLPLKLDEGFCPRCRARFKFTPIESGTLVASQYRVKGPIAIGGCGFVYLAYDENVGQWVVLKGIINSLDPDAMQAAVQEKSYLANLRDPQIVRIINFVTHEGSTFIVMEFVDGVTLKTKRKAGPVAPQEALWCILNVLSGFTFLHENNVIYCDGKLDNFMHQGDRVRIIDMGGCRLAGDPNADVYFTLGYCAPEAQVNPSVQGDIYTLGRCLALLLFDFDWQHQYLESLPTPDQAPVLAQYESLYRLLLRTTARNPADRFQSAAEMADQVYGVLREITALDSHTPHSADSALFHPSLNSQAAGATAFQSLPLLKVDEADPAASLVAAALQVLDPGKRQAAVAQALAQQRDSREAARRLAEMATERGEYAPAKQQLDALLATDPYDWRAVWLLGRLELARNNAAPAYKYFDAVYSELPGELAPKVALAVAAEAAGDLPTATRLYDLVSRVDPTYTSAAFGLARCLAQKGDRVDAVAAYDRVPASSADHAEAVMGRVRTLIEHLSGGADLTAASQALQSIDADSLTLWRLKADLYLAALKRVQNGALKLDAKFQLLGHPAPDEAALRAAAEEALRNCARFAHTKDERYKLIDAANDVRPWT